MPKLRGLDNLLARRKHQLANNPFDCVGGGAVKLAGFFFEIVRL